MVLLLGCNHRSAPLELRERLAFAEDETRAALQRLLSSYPLEEALLLSTCNRVEVLARTAGDPPGGLAAVAAFLCAERGVSPAELERHSYRFVGKEAVLHLFQVAAGLDSMILGEPQILGQVKQAYRQAQEAGATGAVFERLLQQCLATTKRVRAVTGISRHAVSVGFAAVSLARQIFGELAGRTALIIGSGKMGELVARHLASHAIGSLLVTSRTYGHAVVSASRCGGRATRWDEALAGLAQVDIVVSCTGSPRTILSKQQVAEVLRGRRGEPLFMIDIAVPRDIDPEVNELDNVYLYDIDGLQEVVDANLEERRRAALAAQREIARDVETFERWRRSAAVAPTIVALRERLLDTGRRELRRFRGRLGPLSAEQEQVLEQLVRGLVQKILHRPAVELRRSIERGNGEAWTAIYREIFGLEEPVGSAPDDAGAQGQPPADLHRIARGGTDD